ncbi:MAG: glycosyltransferase family 2 protein [Bacteroidales bacterium]
MTTGNTKKIAAISMVRNDNFFVHKWIDYYGVLFGLQNLYLVIDGYDQPLPEKHELINIIQKEHIPMKRSKGDRYRARLISDIAKKLFNDYDMVIAHDIDEYLVVDPDCGKNLSEYLQKPVSISTLSALGLDVGQHPEEVPIDPTQPFLQQRSYAHVSARYTKAIVAARPITWGSGYHRVKGKNFTIDPNLFLFHFGMVDMEMCKQKIDNSELKKSGWSGHFNRRFQLFNLIAKQKAIPGDEFFATARKRQSFFRPIFALNKPGMLKEKPVIKIPKRFQNII